MRLAALLVFGLAALAAQLGLDIVLGGFVAGMITRMAVRGREVSVLESKLAAVGFGLLIPFFFIVSGVEFDLDALLASPSALLKLPLFLGLFLLVRGLPALLLYRGVLPARDRVALAFYCATALPLVVAITVCGDPRRTHAHRNGGRAGRRSDPLDPDLPVCRQGTPERHPEIVVRLTNSLRSAHRWGS